MRKRGLITLALTIPLWIFVLIPGSPLSKPKVAGTWDISETGSPTDVDGALWGVAATTMFAATILVVDLAMEPQTIA